MLVGTKMKTKDDTQLKELVEQELASNFKGERNELKETAEQQILEIQTENKRRYYLRRNPPKQYNMNDIVAIVGHN